MSDKRKLSTILGIAGATVLAAGGSAFVTDTGLSLVDNTTAEVQETNGTLEAKETEQPLTVETFTATKDSFTVKPTSASKTTTDESEEQTETDSDGNVISSGESGSSGENSGSGSSDGSGASDGYYGEDGTYYYYDEDGVLHDEWGGYYASNGDYYDGNGGYWDGDGYHTASSSDSSSSSGSSSSSSSSGSSSSSSSSSGSSSSGAWDDSYMMYDVDSRYVSEDELSSWSSEDLAKLRNEIFARHGRIFTTQKWIDYFATKTWYTPQYDNVDDQLNDYEWANLDVILKLEAERS